MNKIAIILVILLIGGSTYGLQEVEAIEKIVGYVTEAKKKALAEEEAKANATAIADYINKTEDTTNRSDDETNRSDDIDVVKIVLGALGIVEPEPEPEKQYTKIVGIQLSKTCLQMERNNVTSKCPTYQELMQLDNTLPEISGNVTLSDGYWHREATAFKFKHCNWYLDKYPVIIVVDPDGCWQRYTGIRMITIQALDPSDLIFKLKYDRDVIDELLDLQDDERNIDDEKDEADREIDRLEDEIDDFEKRIRELEDDLNKPNCKRDDDTRKIVQNDGCSSSLQSRNFNFQLRFALTGLEKSKVELIEEERIYLNATEYLDSTRIGSQDIKSRYSSTTMFDGSVSHGVGRYVEECRNATIGSEGNLDLLMDTLNYLLFDCTEESTTFESIQTTVKEQTPLYIGNFTEYKYKAWLAEAKETCREACWEY